MQPIEEPRAGAERRCACCDSLYIAFPAPRLFCGSSTACADDAPCRGRCANPGTARWGECECCGERVPAGARGAVRRYCLTNRKACGTDTCRGLCTGRTPVPQPTCREPGCRTVPRGSEWCHRHRLPEGQELLALLARIAEAHPRLLREAAGG